VAGKVSGPGSGPPVGGPVDDKGDGPAGVGGPRFADKLTETKAAKPGEPTAPGAPSSVSAARGLTADVAAELAAGRIDAKAALDRVIARVVDKKVGPNAPAAIREAVRAALESAVADDPVLGEKIKSLGG
jgi:hypothetical protein